MCRPTFGTVSSQQTPAVWYAKWRGYRALLRWKIVNVTVRRRSMPCQPWCFVDLLLGRVIDADQFRHYFDYIEAAVRGWLDGSWLVSVVQLSFCFIPAVAASECWQELLVWPTTGPTSVLLAQGCRWHHRSLLTELLNRQFLSTGLVQDMFIHNATSKELEHGSHWWSVHPIDWFTDL